MQSRDDIVTRNELDGVINAISGRKKSDLQPEEIQGSPNLMLLNVSAEIEIKVKRNMKSSQNKSNPTFLSGGLRQPPSSFEDVFRHFVMNLSNFFWLHSHFSVHGRAHHSFPTSLAPNKSLYLASTFSASPHRGLRHSSQNQKQIQITI